jgi:hypothetical protein
LVLWFAGLRIHGSDGQRVISFTAPADPMSVDEAGEFIDGNRDDEYIAWVRPERPIQIDEE